MPTSPGSSAAVFVRPRMRGVSRADPSRVRDRTTRRPSSRVDSLPARRSPRWRNSSPATTRRTFGGAEEAARACGCVGRRRGFRRQLRRHHRGRRGDAARARRGGGAGTTAVNGVASRRGRRRGFPRSRRRRIGESRALPERARASRRVSRLVGRGRSRSLVAVGARCPRPRRARHDARNWVRIPRARPARSLAVARRRALARRRRGASGSSRER